MSKAYSSKFLALTAALGLLALFARPAPAQQPERAEIDQPFTGELIRTGLYRYSNGGGNTLLRLTANGLILVDGQAAGDYEALLGQIRVVSEQPIRILIVTDHHADRTADSERWLADGTQIVAHSNAARHLGFDQSPGSPVAHSVRTYESELPIHLGGIDAQVLHFDSAHTDGDSVVYFPNLRVVAVGDLLSQNPSPDFTAGGSYVGWASVLDRVLALDFDVVAPGTGPLATRADLEAFKARMEALVSGATRLVRMGVTADEFAQRLAEDNDVGFKLSRDQSAHLLAELSSSQRSTTP